MFELVICGRGGQGVVFLTRQIGQIASAKGMNVISSETHGMAVRGGSINSHLRIGDFASPLIRPGHADILLSLDKLETMNNIHFLKHNGCAIENSNEADEPRNHRIDATAIAQQIGNIQLENVIILGFAASIVRFPIEIIDIEHHLNAEKRDVVRNMNLKALRLGSEAARDH